MYSIVNALTVDVEDYFQVSAFASFFPHHRWDSIPCRVEANVDLLLETFAVHGVRATFFTLGWIAERYPSLVRRVAAGGHEIASHGHAHFRATEQTRQAFFSDIRLAKIILEDVVGMSVAGYRAPSFSIGASNPWAHDCIAEAGYRYSSSIYPVRHDHYGNPRALRFPYFLDNGLLEIPISTARIGGRNWPAGGGGYFRLLPYAVSRWQIRRINETDGRPAIFYFHPWELDPCQPRIKEATIKTRFRHYLNLRRTEARLAQLLSDFAWDRADAVFLETARKIEGSGDGKSRVTRNG